MIKLGKVKTILFSEHVGVFFCLMLAAVFVLYNISMRTFWIDEATMALEALNPLGKILAVAKTGGLSILYIYLTWFWTRAFGITEIAMRAFSLIFLLATVFLGYFTALKLFENKRAGLLASLLISCNYFLIWYGYQARPYTLIAFLGLLVFYFLLEIKDSPGRGATFGYAIFLAAGIYIHPWMVLVFGAHAAIALLFFKKFSQPIKVLLAQGLAVVLSLPAIGLYLYQGRQGISEWSGRPDFSALRETFRIMTYGQLRVFLIFGFLALGFVVYRLVKSKFSFNISETIFKYGSLFAYFLLPLAAGFFVSQYKPMYVAGRYETSVAPAFLLLLAGLFSQIPSRVILAGCLVPLLLITAGKAVNDEHQEVAAYASTEAGDVRAVLGNLQNKDFVITTRLSYAVVGYYFIRFADLQSSKFNLISFPEEMFLHPGLEELKKINGNPQAYQAEIDKLTSRLKTGLGGRIFVFYYSDDSIDAMLLKKLQENFKLVSVYQPPQPRQNSWFDAVLVFQ